MGHKITFLSYDFNKNQFINTNTGWDLPDLETEYYFYNQKDLYIYFAAVNPQTKYHDLMFYNMATQKGCKV